MTAKTDLTAEIVALNRVLAETTKECPVEDWYVNPTAECRHKSEGIDGEWRLITEARFHPSRCLCKGSGRVARFPGFRQECGHCAGIGWYWDGDASRAKHPECNGTGWQVRAGGLEGGLAGLTRHEANDWAEDFSEWIFSGNPPFHMPDRGTILAEGLRLVCEVAELEMPGG